MLEQRTRKGHRSPEEELPGILKTIMFVGCRNRHKKEALDDWE
jgi:hypothetical protein